MAKKSLQQAVRDELAAEPRVDAAEIAVSAEHGVVTLKGTVGSPRQKQEASRAAQRVHGVREVQNDLEVRLLVGDRRDDAELRGAVLQALTLDSMVPATVDAKVDRGMVSLTGRVNWNYQRNEAEFVAGNVRGVRGVRSEIVLDPQPSVVDVEQAIRDQFQRNASLDADSLNVQSVDGTVTLRGYVSSWDARNAAVDAAWSVPGVKKVKDEIEIRY